MLEGARSAEPPRKPVDVFVFLFWGFWGKWFGENFGEKKVFGKKEFSFSHRASEPRKLKQQQTIRKNNQLTGERRRERVEHRLRVQARREALVLGRERRQRLLPARGQLAREQRLQLGALGRVLLHVAGQRRLPLGLGGLAARRGLAEDVVGGLGDLEGAVLPAEVLARGGGLVLAQGGA